LGRSSDKFILGLKFPHTQFQSPSLRGRSSDRKAIMSEMKNTIVSIPFTSGKVFGRKIISVKSPRCSSFNPLHFGEGLRTRIWKKRKDLNRCRFNPLHFGEGLRTNGKGFTIRSTVIVSIPFTSGKVFGR